ncbi:MAG: PmoA family protein [Verrucomicrobiota bacterium]
MILSRRQLCFAAVTAALFTGRAAAENPSAAVTAKLDEAKKTVRVEIGGSLFTELIYAGQPKPVLFPVIGPGGFIMTRQWPILPKAPGEETDHPHHRGLWFAHGAVNGVDFWSEVKGAGKIVVQGLPEIVPGGPGGSVTIKTREAWEKTPGVPVMHSSTVIQLGADGGDRYLDYTITMSAGLEDILLGDTKEGTMAIRVNPLLNLKGEVAKGSAVNSAGNEGLTAWGKHAQWVDYSAPGPNGVIGLACFDSPSNLRAPTTWHARDYGLIAANPFGLHDFEKAPKGAGDYTIKKGGSLTLRYRWLFHTGDAKTARIAERWKTWSESK